ncbi:MAG: tRNA pseudouridine(38-40) synthase TruA [Vulcanimicrobiaceae bacterium]
MGRSIGSGREARRAAPRARDGLTIVRAAVEYDGTAFYGLQFQPNLRTVAGVLERALSQLFASAIKISAAGRTDTGVHASGQVISFVTDRTFPFDRLAIALNSALPSDISVRDIALAPPGFSARFSARERRYVYAIHNAPDRSALLAHSAFHVYSGLDLEPMLAAADALRGEHDFRSFCGALPDNGVTVRCVKGLEIERRGDLIRIEVAADSFVHRMVRTIVGTLVECGKGRRDPRSIPAVLKARERKAAGLTAPAHGLYLAGVKYEDGYDSYREPPIFGSP